MENIIGSAEQSNVLSYGIPKKKKSKWRKILAIGGGLASLLVLTNEDFQNRTGIDYFHPAARGFPTWRTTGNIYSSRGNVDCVFGLGTTLLKREVYIAAIYSDFQNKRKLVLHVSKSRTKIGLFGNQESENLSQADKEIKLY